MSGRDDSLRETELREGEERGRRERETTANRSHELTVGSIFHFHS